MKYSHRNCLYGGHEGKVDGINNYEKLAIFIILQAAKDYRVALRRIKADPQNRKAISKALEVERFFRSGWYQNLTTVDGEYIIRRIQQEMAGGNR